MGDTRTAWDRLAVFLGARVDVPDDTPVVDFPRAPLSDPLTMRDLRDLYLTRTF